MKLYIKQRVFSFKDKYDVYDENENIVYYAKGSFFSFAAKISLDDNMGNNNYFIERKIFTFLPEYHIYKNGNLFAIVKKEFSLFKPKINVSSKYGDFNISGDFFSMTFSIEYNGRLLGSISKRWFSWGDTYEMNISDDTDSAFFCSLVIAIDNCLHNENHSN